MDTQPDTKYLYDGNTVFIFNKKILDKKATEESEELVYIDRPYVKIISPGQRHSIVIRPLKEDDKKNFTELWQAFKNKEDLRFNGTPLRDWDKLLPNMVGDLEYNNVYTVEDLAAVPEGHLANLGPTARQMQNEAKIFLENDPDEGVQLAEANRRIEKLERDIQILMDASTANPDAEKVQDDAINDDTRRAG